LGNTAFESTTNGGFAFPGKRMEFTTLKLLTITKEKTDD